MNHFISESNMRILNINTLFLFCLVALLAAYKSLNLWHGIFCRLLTLIVRLFFDKFFSTCFVYDFSRNSIFLVARKFMPQCFNIKILLTLLFHLFQINYNVISLLLFDDLFDLKRRK